MPRVTSADVARAAGVSQTTVSFVLNGRDMGIAPDTRHAVLAAAAALHYVPSAAARALRTGRTRLVLCVLPPLAVSQAMEEFKERLSADLGSAGYTCLFEHAAPAPHTFAGVLGHVQPAAVVRLGPLPAADRAALESAGTPFVDDVLDPSQRAMSGFDQELIGHLQVRHLHAEGHRSVGYARLSDPLEATVNAARVRGAERCVAELGMQPLRVAELDYTRESAREAIRSWRTGPEPVTAVAAFNDLAALALLAAARVESVRVPEDLGLIGVDDLPLTRLVEPPLSTIRIDLAALARRIAVHVLSLVEEEAPWELPEAVELETVVRGSSRASGS